MAKPNPGSASDSVAAHTAVFIDTSLDTHLALLVSDVDTVSDLKKKILYEHSLCFPSVGKIQIHALKVKRRGLFYHLSDSMFVKSAFDGVNKNWFLCIDASRSGERGENQHSYIPDSNNLLACFGIKNGTSFDMVACPHDDPLKRSSNFDVSSLPLVGNNQKENIPIADRYGSGDSGREVSKEKEALVHGFGKDVSHKDIIVPQNSLGNAGREVASNTRMGNKSTADEPCRSSSSNSSKRSISRIQRTNNLCRETEVPEKHGKCIVNKSKNDIDVQCNKSLEEASQSRPSAKRKRRAEKKIGDQDSLKEKRALTCDSNKVTSKAESASQHSVGDNQKTNVTLDSLATKPVEDVHLLGTDSSSRKNKRRKISSNPLNQIVAAVPSSGMDFREESSRVTVGMNHKDSGGEPCAASVPGQGVQSATTELCEISVKEVGESSKVPSSLVDRQKTNSTLDSLATKDLENVHLLVTDSRSRKKKKKKKSSNPLNLVVEAVPSSGKDVREESSRVTVGINSKDSGREPDDASAGHGVQGPITSELCGISEKEKHCDPFHEVGKSNHVPSFSSPDLDMCNTNAGNVKSKTDASEEQAAVGVERMGTSKDSHIVDLKGPPVVVKELNNLQKDLGLSRLENIVHNDHANCETHQTDKGEEESELSHNKDPKGMLSEKYKSSSQDVTDMKAKEVMVTSKLFDGSGIVEPKKSAKKRWKKRKTEDSVGETPMKSGAEHFKGSEHGISSEGPHKTVNGDHSSNKAKKEGSNFSQTKGKEVSKTKTASTSLLATEKGTGDVNGDEVESLQKAKKEESDFSQTKGKEVSKTKTASTSLLATEKGTGDVNGDEVESLQKISKTQENSENINSKTRKRSKKKQNSTAKNLLDSLTKDQDVDHTDPAFSGNSQREVEASSKMTKEIKSAKTSSNELNRSNLEGEKDLQVEIDLLHAQLNSGTAESSQVPAHTIEGNSKERPVEVNVNCKPPKSGGADEANHQMEVSCESNKTNIDEHLVPSRHQHGVVPSGEVLVENMTKKDIPPNSRKNRKKLDIYSIGTSPDLQSSLKTNEKQGSGGKSQAGINHHQGSLPKDESDEHMLHPDKKLPKVSGSGTKAPRSSKSDKFTSIPEEARRPEVVNASKTNIGSGKNSEASAVPNPNLESSKNIVHQNKLVNESRSSVGHYRQSVGKASVNDIGEVLNTSKHDRSLLTKSGAIFKDDSSGSSEDEDEDGVANSDASTRTPSDNSLSSEYSDGESNANLSSPRNGLYDSRRKGGGRSTIKSCTSGGKSLTLDTILRSSSRYKKAKLTATQSQLEDSESQPVDFVPDSQV